MRKQYRTIIWSVGILEKIILRWRRKGSGLRGYKSDALNKEPIKTSVPQKEDDYDFLKEGRRQTEERLQKALTRVKSMVQYPEARAQYRRILTVCEGFRENKVSFFSILSQNMNLFSSFPPGKVITGYEVGCQNQLIWIQQDCCRDLHQNNCCNCSGPANFSYARLDTDSVSSLY